MLLRNHVSTFQQFCSAEIIKKGTVVLNIFMAVQSELNQAIASCSSDCEEGSEDCNADAIHSWDLAVGWYSGSLEGESVSGSSSGRFLHKLAERRCALFNTCNDDRGLSSVNDELFQRFHAGQHHISKGKASPILAAVLALF